jgi:hypothetical protein
MNVPQPRDYQKVAPQRTRAPGTAAFDRFASRRPTIRLIQKQPAGALLDPRRRVALIVIDPAMPETDFQLQQARVIARAMATSQKPSRCRPSCE